MTNRFEFLSPASLERALAAAQPPALVDVRSPAAFAAGHLPGAVSAPVHRLGELRALLPAHLASRLVVIGDDRRRTRAAAQFLALIGFGDVVVLDGGIGAYRGRIESGPAPPPTRPGPELRVIPSAGPGSGSGAGGAGDD